MANFIAFNEGKTELINNGLPATCRFLLSTRGVAAGTQHAAGNTLATGVGEITGTGPGLGAIDRGECCDSHGAHQPRNRAGGS